jgi:transcriptional regulator of stress and heat shock response
MPNLTDYIEEYLKKLLALSSSRHIEIRRRELAGKFSCVPSQINYVLERRFTMDRGYLVESRRGGSGCIRIYRIEPEQVKPWRELIESLGEDNFEPNRVIALLTRLVEEKIISRRESMVLKAVVSDEIYARTGLSEEQSRQLQRSLFVSALRELLKTGY